MAKLSRGFKNVRKKINETKGTIRSVRSCASCDYFFIGDDGEEICHNSAVTSFDITEEENKTYCTFYLPIGVKKDT